MRFAHVRTILGKRLFFVILKKIFLKCFAVTKIRFIVECTRKPNRTANKYKEKNRKKQTVKFVL